MNDSKLTGLEILGLIGCAIAILFYRLFVITRAWQYIAVPMGAHQIGMWNAFCLSLVLTAFDPGSRPSEKKADAEMLLGMITSAIVKLTIVWGLAYWIGG